MSEQLKRYAEIDGKLWLADYPLCAGCPELIAAWYCGYEGNGCRFPDSRAKKPINYKAAFEKVAKGHGGGESFCKELGPCTGEEPVCEVCGGTGTVERTIYDTGHADADCECVCVCKYPGRSSEAR